MDSTNEPDRGPTTHEHTFVLRIRHESGSGSAVRATIRHLSSGTEISTADLTEVDDFVRLRVAGDD